MTDQIYKKRKVCDMIIKHGVDLSNVLNSTPYSYCRRSCLTLLYLSGPRSFVHDIACQHIGLEEYWRMTRVNSWILRTIARADSRFRAKLRSEEKAWRYVQSEPRPKSDNQGLDFSIESQAKEMKRSSHLERKSYLTAICAGGAAFELDALLAYPQEIPELDVNEDNGMRSRIYLHISATCGNIETFHRLLDAGVDAYSHQKDIWYILSGGDQFSTRFQTSGNSHEISTQMMKRLLANVSATLSVALLPMIVLSNPKRFIWPLHHLENFTQSKSRISKQIQTNSLSDPLKNGALVAAAAIARNVPALKLLIQNGFDLEWEDEYGFTPLMIAIAKASSEVIKILIDAGANLEQSKPCGFSVCELVRAIVLHLRSHDRLVSSYSDKNCVVKQPNFYYGYSNYYWCPPVDGRDILKVLTETGTLRLVAELGFDCPEIHDVLSQGGVAQSSKSKL